MRNEPSRQIKNQEAGAADYGFNVIRKNPEKQHIAYDVPNASVQKHAGDERIHPLALSYFSRNGAVLHDELPLLVALT